jgi:hypothetical protein
MCRNGKMRHVETIPGIGEEVIKNDGGGEFNYDILLELSQISQSQCTPSKT